ncbi:hypothetical protein COV23_01610 [Candidatus Wolfebacteria bacterium CG10_big_fil_rev_8_21_14_0_10_31_9]|uniref:Uncharacterized protein n=1 Tax=Candidatus Wolfebacteria bacterium CG10_big_fil_rev_8_21_14_0_10_31_9 TaxID=1975070 RepID=A0A2H0RCA9_9BACT|nr:MAG: hypothetical protein COV23_01610 [Candidatus Wolfebacteria bacterium CG10_big_fil_rev_8_21_14_0_10_31_9]
MIALQIAVFPLLKLDGDAFEVKIKNPPYTINITASAIHISIAALIKLLNNVKRSQNLQARPLHGTIPVALEIERNEKFKRTKKNINIKKRYLKVKVKKVFFII